MSRTKILYPLTPRSKVNDNFYVADTETGIKEKLNDNEEKVTWQLEARPDKFIFGAVYGRNYNKIFHSREDMVNEFKDPRYKNKKVFFHNFGKFDGSVLFDNIFTLDKEAIFIGSRFISCTNGNCIFGDSLNIYKASVKEIGEKAGEIKSGMGDDYAPSIWPRDKGRDETECLHHCQIVWDALVEMFEEVGDIKLTIGSCSMSYFRRYCMSGWIESGDFVKEFWKSYYGGRTEAFKMGKVEAKVIDVNSEYPYCMKVIDFPNPKYLRYEQSPRTDYFINSILPNYEGMALCNVYHPPFFIGLLPYRMGGKLKFPCGRFQGYYNFNELRFAISHGVVIENISFMAYAEKMVSPFVNFVEKLSLEKFKAHEDERKLDEWKYKYLQNNLYGKFGQRIDEKTIYLDDVVEQYPLIQEHQRQKTFIKLIPFSSVRCDAFLIVKAEKKSQVSYSIPSFSSYITSAGRVMLGEKLILMKENKPVYCDTDSIAFLHDTDGEILRSSNNYLGGWKLEPKIITEIRGPKNYSFRLPNGKVIDRIKGVPGRALKNEKDVWEFVTLIGTKEGMRRNIDIGTPAKRTKVISGIYDKRIVLEDGETLTITI